MLLCHLCSCLGNILEAALCFLAAASLDPAWSHPSVVTRQESPHSQGQGSLSICAEMERWSKRSPGFIATWKVTAVEEGLAVRA